MSDADTRESAAPPIAPPAEPRLRTAVDLPEFPEAAWRGLFADYRALMEPISECAGLYHYANFLALVLAEHGAGIVIAEGMGMYLNEYILCCGVTGTKKSTASDLVEDCIAAQMPERMHTRNTSVSSGEALVRVLQEHQNLFLCYDEVKTLFVTAGRQGSTVESNLNTAYGLRDLYNTRAQRVDSKRATAYYLNLLVNGTPDHMLDVSVSIYKGGLINRFLVFYGAPTDRYYNRMLEPDAAKAKAIVEAFAARRNEWLKLTPTRASVRMDFTPEANALHKEWYDRTEKAKREMPELEAKPLSRLDTHAKKLAAAYRLMEGEPSPTPLITVEQTASALAVTDYCKEAMLAMVRQWTGQKSPQQQAEQIVEERIEAYLDKHGCVEERRIYQHLHLSAHEGARGVNALVAMGVATVSGERPRIVHRKGRCEGHVI